MTRQHDPLLKSLARTGYRTALGLKTVSDTLWPTPQDVRVFYGGARSGDVGGPLVKVKRLQEFFPEYRQGYSLVYLLSNAPYLPPFALSVLKHRGIPMVHNQNGVFYPGWFEGDWARENRKMADSYHAADYIFWQSEFCRRCADRFLGDRDGEGEILFNAIDTGRFTPRSRGDEHEGPFVFLLTGKIGRHLAYRIDGCVDALAEVTRAGLEAKLVVAGWVDPEVVSHACRRAEKAGIGENLSFTGAYTQEQAPGIYQSADAYLMTKHNDPCPNTVLEAMSSGLPIVYSHSGGVPELVGPDAGVGVWVEEDFERHHEPESSALADAMLQVAERQPVMSDHARKRAVARFDIEHWIERHSVVFNRLVKERS